MCVFDCVCMFVCFFHSYVCVLFTPSYVCVFVQVPVGPPSEVEEIFDTISYAKGSCVIRMLHDWIGTEVSKYWQVVGSN